MTLLTVLTVPDPRLRVKALPVSQVDETIRRLMADMLETMYHAEGIGLAATQVGVNSQVIVVDLTERTEDVGILKLANPEIIWRSSETQQNLEGCLSIPGQSAKVERATAINLRYLDDNNCAQERHFQGWAAVCLQHEIDHLQGTLYVDHLSALKKQLIIEKARKYEKASLL